MTSLDAVQEHFGGRRYETYVAILCPYHEDSHPSMLVFEDRYRCLGCGKTGRTAELMGVSPAYAPPKPQYVPPNPQDLDTFAVSAHKFILDNPEFQQYYKDRGVGAFIEQGLLGFWNGWYTIPIFNATSQIEQIVYRTSPFMQEQTGQRYIVRGAIRMYAPRWDKLLTAPVINITYGIFDAISLTLLGYPAVTATGGKDLFDAEWLCNFRKPIRIFPDKGEEETARKLAIELGWRGHVVNFPYPSSCKDINDMAVQYPHELHEFLKGFKYE